MKPHNMTATFHQAITCVVPARLPAADKAALWAVIKADAPDVAAELTDPLAQALTAGLGAAYALPAGHPAVQAWLAADPQRHTRADAAGAIVLAPLGPELKEQVQ